MKCDHKANFPQLNYIVRNIGSDESVKVIIESCEIHCSKPLGHSGMHSVSYTHLTITANDEKPCVGLTYKWEQ